MRLSCQKFPGCGSVVGGLLAACLLLLASTYFWRNSLALEQNSAPLVRSVRSLDIQAELRAASFARLWPSRAASLKSVAGHPGYITLRVPVNGTNFTASPDDRKPDIVSIKSSMASVRLAGMPTCALTRDSYRCSGPKYEQYLREHIAPANTSSGADSPEEAAYLPRDTVILFLGDSHLREVAAALLCEMRCPAVDSDDSLLFMTGYWPDTNTRLVSIANWGETFRPCQECKQTGPVAADYEVLNHELNRSLSPLLRGQEGGSAPRVVLVHGNVVWYTNKKSVVYVPTKRMWDILRLISPVAKIVTVFTWVSSYPGYPRAAIPQLKTWCANHTSGASCVRPHGMPICAADFQQCSGSRGYHQCLPGLPTLLARRLLSELHDDPQQ